MLKQFFLMLILTIIGVYFIKELGIIFHGVEHLQILASTYIAKAIPITHYKLLISHTITLLLVPIAIALIPVSFYWLFTKREAPRLAIIFWLFWFVSLIVFALIKP